MEKFVARKIVARKIELYKPLLSVIQGLCLMYNYKDLFSYHFLIIFHFLFLFIKDINFVQIKNEKRKCY